MAGVLPKGIEDGVEPTGVYMGTLKEDMIKTVQKVGKPFIDVFIPDLFFEDANYPLTYVPVFNIILPLKKDQKVWVYFNQENHRYPILWKVDKDNSGSGTVNIGVPDSTLGSLISEFMDLFIGMTTVGSPGSHTLDPTGIADMTNLKMRWEQVFK